MTWSALSYRGRTVCYEIAGDHIEARELGHSQPLTVDEELRQAIKHDIAREAAKREAS